MLHQDLQGDQKMEARKAVFVRPVDRINFVLRTLVVTAMAFAIAFLAEGLLHLKELPHYLFVLQRTALIGLVGRFLFRTINGRLLDAGLARWYKFPVFALWLASISLPVLLPHWSALGPALFALLLFLGGSVPGKQTKQTQLEPLGIKQVVQEGRQTSAPVKKASSLPLIDRIGFLRSLLTLACLWLPLIWLEGLSGNHLGAWFARLCYCILWIAWAVKVIGRLEDAGKAPTVRQGLLVIFLLLSVGMIRRLEFQSRTEWWRGLPGFNTAAILSQRLIHFNGYEKIGLFLVIQVPLAFLPSRPIPTTSVSENDGAERTARQPIKAVKTNELALCGPFEYLRILLVIAGVCVPLIYMDYASNSGVGSWVARTGYVILSFFWLTFAHGRLKDAGWAHNAYPSQYFLIVSVASLMPLAAHWVSGYGALAIFVILQIPTAFLESVPLLEEES